jgi:triosephosphate isomerase
MKRINALVVANWKLNPISFSDAKALFTEVRRKLKKDISTTVVVAPPFLFISEFSKTLKSEGVKLGAQDVFYEEVGPFTGEISVGQLASLGVSHIIVGHSERRALGETDDQVNKKIKAILKRRLTPIVCIGERVRDDQGTFFNDIESQIKSLTQGLLAKDLTKTVIAYEPIWAIGTGKTATVEDVKEMQLFIVSTLTKLYDRKTAEKVKLLYGGSVKASIAKDLYEQGGMNGFLVGGASLNAEEFVNIVKVTE